MITRRTLASMMILAVPGLTACAPDLGKVLSEESSRRLAIEVLMTDPVKRGDVIDRLLNDAEARSALLQKAMEDEKSATALIQQMMLDERFQAQIANTIAADQEMTHDFLRKLMLTGAVGAHLTQPQAERLGLGEAFAHGNQIRTMTDLKRLGVVVDRWAHGHEGAYPVCDRYDIASGCLASLLPQDALGDLRLSDAWGRPFHYQSDSAGKTYALISYATDGEYDMLGRAGPTSSYDSDIVYADGDFVQWPGRIRKDSIQ